MENNNVFLSIIVPAYNESNRIIKSLNKLVQYIESKSNIHEIIVVNDGSLDNTVDVVNDFVKKHTCVKLISYAENKGKGYATKTGVLNSTGKYVLFTDADLSTPIEEFENLFDRIKEGNDIVFGSRSLDKKKVLLAQPFYRRFFSYLAKIYVSLLIFTFAIPPKDALCGFKLFTRKSADLLFRKQKTNGGMFDIELLLLARKYNLKTKEVSVVWMNDRDSKINFVKCVLFDPIDLIKIRMRDLFDNGE